MSKLILTNACLFDTIFHILCVSFVDSEEYLEVVLNNTNQELFKLIVNSGFYLTFFQLLRTLRANTTSLDTSSTANHMIKTLFENFPSYEGEIIQKLASI